MGHFTVNEKTPITKVMYLKTNGTPREKKEATEEYNRRTGDLQEGGEEMKKKVMQEVPAPTTTDKEKVSRRREVFKVRSKGDLGVPQHVAIECGILNGTKFTCQGTGQKGEILIKAVA